VVGAISSEGVSILKALRTLIPRRSLKVIDYSDKINNLLAHSMLHCWGKKHAPLR